MTDPALVKVLDACDELSVKLCCLLFLEPCVTDDIIEKFAAVRMFHYHEEFLFSFDDLHRKVTHTERGFTS